MSRLKAFLKSVNWNAVTALAAAASAFVATGALRQSTRAIVAETEVRRQEQYFSGWAEIREARTFRKSGARDYALEKLNSAGESFDGIDLKLAYLHGMQLPHAELRDAILTGAVFDSANLIQARFEGAHIHGASFRDADLRGAHFDGADFSEDGDSTYFTRADLREAVFDGAADVHYAVFRGADMRGVTLWSPLEPTMAMHREVVVPLAFRGPREHLRSNGGFGAHPQTDR